MTTNPAMSFPTSSYSTFEGHPLRYENLRTLLQKQNSNVPKTPKPGKKSRKFKRIVICCDGTWQRSDGLDKAPPSNVTRIARSIKSYAKKDKIQQIVYYQRGVGTSGKIDKILGGGTGVGLDDNIRVAYGFIAHNYHKNDEIFLIGFSRGAYTVRSVCGLISTIGVLTKKGMNDFADIWRTYTSKEGFTPEYEPVYLFSVEVIHGRMLKAQGTENRIRGIQELWDRGKKVVTPVSKVCIKAIGCWDTVGALGVPSIEIKIPFYGTKLVNTVDTGHKKIGFHDVQLSDSIENAFHALALDENRGPFTPTLWRRQSGSKTNLKQVWFPGVHSNVGGGYENQEIADVTLGWMIQSLSPFLEFSKSNLIELLQNDVHDEQTGLKDPKLQWAGGKIEDSSDTILMWLMSGVHRTPGGYLHHQDIKRGIKTEESIHRSVSIRYKMDPTWRPKGLEGWTYDEEQGLWENKAENKELLEDHLGEVEKQLAGQWVLENMCGEKWSGKWLGRW